MKKLNQWTILLLLPVVILAGCKNKKADEKSLITRRIQYDVPIKASDADNDWWVQNIEGQDREKLVKEIMESALSGKVKTYDFFSNELLTPDQLKAIMKRSDTITLERAAPPHSLYDTVLTKELSLRDITRLRFLEEWNMDKKTLQFNKKVAGICPLIANYGDSAELRGYMPLFWVFFDDKYPGELKMK
ncbi:MAG TPA: hypothetical protein PLJ84_09940 [Bacteroidales bacterium]|nr:hypothetical protein [Bacteroidales bacterium]HPT02907.1 hypothetical protein [Bacteroidales bacterium]